MEIDSLANKIIKQTSENDLILFCSNHGLEGGREKAFYSLNHELQLNNSHITDFRGILSELSFKKQGDIGGLDF